MDQLTQIVTGLSISRPKLNSEQLLALVNPEPVAEQRVAAEVGPPHWIYSVEGKSYDGYFITVRAALPSQADQLAMQALQDLITDLKEQQQNTGIHAEVQVRTLQ